MYISSGERIQKGSRGLRSNWFWLTFEGFEEVDRREEGTPGRVDDKDEGTGRADELYIF